MKKDKNIIVKEPIILFSCDITRGRLIGCKDAIGGLKAVYFVNYEDSDPATYTYGTEREITAFDTPEPAPLPNAYKYDLHLGNDLTQNIQSSAENGTLYFEQVLSLTLKKLSKEDNAQIQELSSGHPRILVEDQMGNVWMVGLINGADVTSGTAVTGSAFGDLNGYTLAFTGMERELANYVEGGMTLVGSSFVIVEGTVAP